MEPALFDKLVRTGLIALLASSSLAHSAPKPDYDTPQEYAEICKPWDKWSKPGPIFPIDDPVTGNTSYVGSCGITMLIVAIEDGVVLIDTGEEQFHETQVANLKRAGAAASDVRYILTSHERFDHVGGLARMQAASGAKIITSPAAKRVIETGHDAPDDPQFGMHKAMAPASVWRTLDDGEVIDLGGVAFTAHHSPGHTPGALTWSWTGSSDGEPVSIVYADSLSPVSREGYLFSDHPDYVAAYRAGLERIAKLDCDILLTPHPGASFVTQRAATGRFTDGMTCAEYAAAVERRLAGRLMKEREMKGG